VKIQSIVIVAIVLVMSESVFGLISSISLEELVEKSDFIVIGTLGEVSEFTKWRTDYSRGVITVEEVLWGKLAVGEKLVLEWRNWTGARVGRQHHEKWEKRKVIWLLTFDEKGYVLPCWFFCVREVRYQDDVMEILRGMPDKEVKEYTAVGSVEELLSAGRPLMSLTTFVLTITAVIVAVVLCVLWKLGPENRILALKMLAVLLTIPIILIVAYWHVRVYDWIQEDKFTWRAAFVAIMVVLFYGTIGLACHMAYRKR
jgi:hypothetical protein